MPNILRSMHSFIVVTVMLNIDYAVREDNKAIKRIMRNTQMESPISIAFDRQPSYFDSLKLEGNDYITIVGKDQNGIVRGFGTCVFKKAFINGNIETIGYLHNLRLEKGFRDGYSLALGYKKFRESVHSKKAFCYITSILKQNKKAQSILTSGKGGLPSYLPLTEYRTFIIKSGVKMTKNNINIKQFDNCHRERIYDFIMQYGKSHNFFPYLSKRALFDEKTLNINSKNIYFTEEDNTVTAMAGLWDISSVKQLYIASYSPMVNILRPFHNILSLIRKTPSLPSVNKQLSYSYIFPFIAGNADRKIILNLIDTLSEMSVKRGNRFFITGCVKGSSMESILNTYPHIRVDSSIYAVDWYNDLDINTLRSNPLHIEVARL